MNAWKPNDRAVVVVDKGPDAHGMVEIRWYQGRNGTVPAFALHELPAMSAEDAAIIAAAENMVEWWGKDVVFFCKEPDAMVKAVRARAAVRSRAAPSLKTGATVSFSIAPDTVFVAGDYRDPSARYSTDPSPADQDGHCALSPHWDEEAVAGLRERVVGAAMAWLVFDETMGRLTHSDAEVDLLTATNDLRTALKPEPVDPVAELREAGDRVIKAADESGARLGFASTGQAEHLRHATDRLRAALAAVAREAK